MTAIERLSQILTERFSCYLEMHPILVAEDLGGQILSLHGVASSSTTFLCAWDKECDPEDSGQEWIWNGKSIEAGMARYISELVRRRT